MTALSIVRPGMLTTVQDLGRWGYQSRGVPVSGSLDWASHRLANRLVGNEPGAATLEVTLIGPQVRFVRAAAFAVAGAEFRLTLDDTPVAMDEVVEAKAGATLKFGDRLRGARAYLAIDGGVDVPKVLGSRSTHLLTAMGGHHGRALRSGDELDQGVGRFVTGSGGVAEGVGRSPSGGVGRPPDPFKPKLRVIAVQEDYTRHLSAQRFQVSARSDRMGYRLEGATIPVADAGELLSTAVPTGAIQVPPGGQPILLMNDHATTGGYAVAAVVISADLPHAAQLAPGDSVEFEACSLEQADEAMREWEAVLGS